MTWLNEPLAILDTETTSADPEDARIVQIYIGLVERPGGPLLDVLNMLVNPGVPIPAEATAIHGITNADVADAISSAAAVEAIAEKLTMIYGTPVVGHNLAYDLTVLEREFDRNDYGLPVHPILDTLVLFRRFDFTTGGRTLSALAKRNGITFPAHDAKADAFASLRLLHILAKENDLLEHTPVDVLQGLQAKWYAAQHQAIYFKRRGNGHNDPEPDTAWPIRPRQESTA